MVRKQFYIKNSQNRELKRNALSLAVSEAEVVRQALDGFFTEKVNMPAHPEEMKLLVELMAEARTLSKSHRFPEGYKFSRKEPFRVRGRPMGLRPGLQLTNTQELLEKVDGPLGK